MVKFFQTILFQGFHFRRAKHTSWGVFCLLPCCYAFVFVFVVVCCDILFGNCSIW